MSSKQCAKLLLIFTIAQSQQKWEQDLTPGFLHLPLQEHTKQYVQYTHCNSAGVRIFLPSRHPQKALAKGAGPPPTTNTSTHIPVLPSLSHTAICFGHKWQIKERQRERQECLPTAKLLYILFLKLFQKNTCKSKYVQFVWHTLAVLNFRREKAFENHSTLQYTFPPRNYAVLDVNGV